MVNFDSRFFVCGFCCLGKGGVDLCEKEEEEESLFKGVCNEGKRKERKEREERGLRRNHLLTRGERGGGREPKKKHFHKY